jgi:hypothetical protein
MEAEAFRQEREIYPSNLSPMKFASTKKVRALLNYKRAYSYGKDYRESFEGVFQSGAVAWIVAASRDNHSENAQPATA